MLSQVSRLFLLSLFINIILSTWCITVQRLYGFTSFFDMTMMKIKWWLEMTRNCKKLLLLWKQNWANLYSKWSLAFPFSLHGYTKLMILFPFICAIQCDRFYSMVNKILYDIHSIWPILIFFPFSPGLLTACLTSPKVQTVSKWGWWTVMAGSSLAEKLQLERKSVFIC